MEVSSFQGYSYAVLRVVIQIQNPLILLPRGAFHRQARNYSRAVDELLTAVDKCGGQREGNAVYAASCRQLGLTYNDFAVLCFK